MKRTWAYAALCGLMCVVYAALAWYAVSGKSATFDEPSHTVIAWLMRNQHDFRQSPDVPPLWEYWISLALPTDSMRVESPHDNSPAPLGWFVKTLYQTPGNDGIALVARCRAMTLILAILTGPLIVWWGWKLAGPAAAAIAAIFWGLDPNLLGHGALVKNDVPIALIYGLLGYFLWQGGLNLNWRRAAAICFIVAVGAAVKPTGLAFLPVAGFLLLIRSMMAEPWRVLGMNLLKRRIKFLAAMTLCIAAALSTYIVLWASYDFRFDAGPDDRQLVTQTPNWIESHHLLPQGFVEGLQMVQKSATGKGAFLCGESYFGGRWDYFPLAVLFKEPLATLAAVGASICIGLANVRILKDFTQRWAAIALLLPPAVYFLAAMFANVDLGIRYLFPIYPYVFVAMGVAFAWLWRRIWWGRLIVPLLIAGLAIETLAAYPDYIAFFNAAVGGERGGKALLADSNLDWGQDLPLLAAWQKQHPTDPLYLMYFGSCDPAAYGIVYHNVPGGYGFGPPQRWPTGSGVAAISATILDETEPDAPNNFATHFLDRQPTEVLGGSIYLFDFSLPAK